MTDTSDPPGTGAAGDGPDDSADQVLGGFCSLAELHRAHLGLMADQDSLPSGRSLPAAEVEAFLERIAATGSVLGSPDDRAIAQRILDYWSADLVDSGRTGRERRSRPDLVPFGAETEAPPAPPPDTTEEKPKRRPEMKPAQPSAEGRTFDAQETREYIRLAALARQYKETGLSGYLLGAGAIDAARKFRTDPDIADLIEASRARGSTVRNRILTAMAVALLLVSGLAVLAFVQMRKAQHEREVAQQEQETAQRERDLAQEYLAEAQAQNKQAAAALAARDEAVGQLQAAFEAQAEESRINRERAVLATDRQRLLDLAVEELADLVADGTPIGSMPEDLRPDILGSIAAKLRAGSVDIAALAPDVVGEIVDLAPLEPLTAAQLDAKAVGYNPAFLDLPLPIPGADPKMHPGLWAGGAAVPYLNFGIVLSEALRQPVVAAVNIDRSGVVTLPSAGDGQPAPDPRLPAAAQPDLRPRLAAGDVAGFLVGQNDIAWGPALRAEPQSAAALVGQMVAFQPNRVAISPATAADWAAVRDWVWTRHNPVASRVTLFSGPIHGSGGDTVEALWLVAVSMEQQQVAQKAPEPRLVIDAFVVPNRAGPAPEKGAAPDAEAFRSSVGAIAARAGLSFVPVLTPGAGVALADAVLTIAADSAAARRSTTQRLVQALRDDGLAPAEQPPVVQAILDLLSREAELSAEGRINVLFLLSEIPARKWDQPDWAELRAEARWGFADLAARDKAERVLTPQPAKLLKMLRGTLGLDTRQPQVVYIQFAGYTRDTANGLADNLAELGWNTQPTERIATASGLNEVRYGPGRPEDAVAARLLAADVSAAGHPGAVAKLVRAVKPGVLEIWTGSE